MHHVIFCSVFRFYTCICKCIDKSEVRFKIKFSKEINDLEEEIVGLESKIHSAYDELERYNDELDYEDDDTVDINDVKGFIQKVEVELL